MDPSWPTGRPARPGAGLRRPDGRQGRPAPSTFRPAASYLVDDRGELMAWHTGYLRRTLYNLAADGWRRQRAWRRRLPLLQQHPPAVPQALVGSAGGAGSSSPWRAGYTLRWIYHGSI